MRPNKDGPTSRKSVVGGSGAKPNAVSPKVVEGQLIAGAGFGPACINFLK
jgi:hypothetical protein